MRVSLLAFKRHYHRFHIQNTVDRDDRREDNNFKVDQLTAKVDQPTAMMWSLAAWKETTPTKISNCFQHTGPFDDGASYSDAVEKAVEEDLVRALWSFQLRGPMQVDELLNTAAEKEAAHVELTDSEIIELMQDEEEPAAKTTEKEQELATYSKDEQLRSIVVLLSMLDLTDQKDQIVRSCLCYLQTDLRHQNEHQTTLDSWMRA